MKRTLILGGGFGGLTDAHELAQRLGAAHEVNVIDREPE
jgi:NADH dehydrogenase FAD-containing subunit